jgi:hypothetical protein
MAFSDRAGYDTVISDQQKDFSKRVSESTQ